MENALDLGKTSAKGSLNLFIGVAFSNLIMAVGTIILTRVLSPARALIGLLLAIALIPPFGILGVIAATLFCGVPSMIWGLYWIWKRYKVKAEFTSSAKILAVSTLAIAPSFLATRFMHTAAWIQLVVGLAIYLTIYVLGAPISGAVSQSEIDTLRTMFSGLGNISKIVNIPLSAAEKAARIRARKRLQ